MLLGNFYLLQETSKLKLPEWCAFSRGIATRLCGVARCGRDAAAESLIPVF
jgi:hypothetical protein